jgi:putative (di)nucleoside polyphosphate hydrolase
MSKKFDDTVFRANVGAVIINENGLILAFERSKIQGAWQLPQGGMDKGEKTIDAVYREIREETSISSSDLAFIAEYPEWLAYELEEIYRTPKLGRGQVQKWFLFKFIGTESAINLEYTKPQEFSHWKWVKFEELIVEVIAFRKPIYQKLMEEFSKYDANPRM